MNEDVNSENNTPNDAGETQASEQTQGSELYRLRKILDSALSNEDNMIQARTKSSQQLAEELKELAETLATADTAAEALSPDELEQERAQLGSYYDSNKKAADKGLKDRKAIEKATGEHLAEITEAKDELKNAETAIEEAQKNHKDAQDRHDKINALFEQKKNYGQDIEKKLAELNSRKKDVEAAEKAKQYVQMSLLLGKFKQLLGEIQNIKTQDAYKKELYGLCDDLIAAKAVLREQQQKLDKAKADLDTAKTKHSAVTAKPREDEIVKTVSDSMARERPSVAA